LSVEIAGAISGGDVEVAIVNETMLVAIVANISADNLAERVDSESE